MSASSDAVFHRRNKQIQDAIDGQNLKQALQLCEKRIKKGEDTRFLRVRCPFLFLFSYLHLICNSVLISCTTLENVN